MTDERRADLAARGWWAGWCHMWLLIGMEVAWPMRDLWELCDHVSAYRPLWEVCEELGTSGRDGYEIWVS